MKNKSILYRTVATKQTVFAQQTTKSTMNFLRYVNFTYGIKLQFAYSWDKEENGQDRIQKLTLLHSLLQ
jgi:hypothetical protein